MSVQRYRYDPFGECFKEHENGNVVFWKDHQQEIDHLHKIIEDIKNCRKVNASLMSEVDALKRKVIGAERFKPNKDDNYLVRWRYDTHSINMEVKRYIELAGFLNYLAEDSSIIDISVSALNPVKVTSKKVLTVEL